MARLRTPDGRSLEASTSTLRVSAEAGSFQDPPGGLTAHPELLAPFLEAVGALLDGQMQRAEHDGTLGVKEQEHVIQGVLLGQAVCVGLEAHAARHDPELLELVNDLAATLDVLGPLGHGVLARLPAINAAAGLGGLEGVPLLPGEFAHAVAVVLDHADRTGTAVGPAARSRLDWAGHRPPDLLKRPLEPTRAALTPPATREAARMPREQTLRALAQSRLEGERNAALLLLHVNGRDRLENAPVVRVLDVAQVLLLSLRGEGGGPAVDTLLALHGELHQDLGAPHLPEARHLRRRGLGDPASHTRAARRLLRRLRYDRQREPTPAEARHLQVLWDALRALDRDLAAGITPDQDDALRARLVLLSLQGLTSTSRAPGTRLPAMVQLAAQISGTDPLWAWERTQPGGPLGDGLHGDLGRLIRCAALMQLHGTAYWEAWGARVRRLTALAAGHLFATVRRAGLRLPGQVFLEAYFARLGPLRALPLSPAERGRLAGGARGSAARGPRDGRGPAAPGGRGRGRGGWSRGGAGSAGRGPAGPGGSFRRWAGRPGRPRARPHHRRPGAALGAAGGPAGGRAQPGAPRGPGAGARPAGARLDRQRRVRARHPCPRPGDARYRPGRAGDPLDGARPQRAAGGGARPRRALRDAPGRSFPQQRGVAGHAAGERAAGRTRRRGDTGLRAGRPGRPAPAARKQGPGPTPRARK